MIQRKMGGPQGALSVESLPQCWFDDVRMNALFAPFRLKTVNPESWDMKMKFWSDMLRQWCRYKGDAIVTAADARVAFQRKERTPACIEIVIEEMFRNGDLVPISKYQQILHNGPEGWMRWGARLAFKPAAIALTAVTMLMPTRQAVDSDGLPKASIESTQRFVHESVLKEQATQMLQCYPSGAERVGTIDELMKESGWTSDRDSFEICLGWLVANGCAVVRGNVVKLAEPDKKVSPITDTDEAKAKLIIAESRLEIDLSRLSREVETTDNDARAAMKLGNKVAAKNHLRRKHKAIQRLDRCTAALDNVKQLLQNIRDMDSNRAIVDTYKTTSEAMKRNMKDNNMDEDSVHNTMDDLKEVMEAYNEIEKALGTTDDYDAAEFEAELKDLLSTPGAGGGTPGKEVTKPTPTNRKVSEREFIFDGEERIIAELNELSVEDASPPAKDKVTVKKVAVTDTWEVEDKPEETPKPSKSWYPPSSECLKDTWTNNNDTYEVRQDDRLHPGQTLNIDYKKPPKLYNTDFQVRDHKLNSHVWLYNKDDNSNVDGLGPSTAYFSTESPGKSSGHFQMAPGGERKKKSNEGRSDVEDLERRLKNLRGLNLQN